MNVRVHIERLVLDGLDPGPGRSHRLQGAVEAELSRLLAGGDWPAATVRAEAIDRLDAPGIQLHQRMDPHQLGRQIAGSVYGGIRS